MRVGIIGTGADFEPSPEALARRAEARPVAPEEAF